MRALPSELQALIDQIDACERDADALIAGLDDDRVNAAPPPGARVGAWSVAQCLDHLAKTNVFYLRQMPDCLRTLSARAGGPFSGLRPTPIGRWFAGSMEPPVRFKVKTPMPAPGPRHRLADLVPAFRASHTVFRDLVHGAADVDINRVIVPNPFHPIVRMRLSTILLIIPAHDRRHLWQAHNVKRALRAGA
jgi:hypothetical protein